MAAMVLMMKLIIRATCSQRSAMPVSTNRAALMLPSNSEPSKGGKDAAIRQRAAEPKKRHGPQKTEAPAAVPKRRHRDSLQGSKGRNACNAKRPTCEVAFLAKVEFVF